MTRTIDRQQLLSEARIVAAPAVSEARACTDHSFELPGALYAVLAALFFGFIAIMAVGFTTPALVVPMGINFAFLTAFFAVPAIFASGNPALRWSEFVRKGIDTATGHSSAGEATVLVLTLPTLLLCWGIAIITIAALV